MAIIKIDLTLYSTTTDCIHNTIGHICVYGLCYYIKHTRHTRTSFFLKNCENICVCSIYFGIIPHDTLIIIQVPGTLAGNLWTVYKHIHDVSTIYLQVTRLTRIHSFLFLFFLLESKKHKKNHTRSQFGFAHFVYYMTYAQH